MNVAGGFKDPPLPKRLRSTQTSPASRATRVLAPRVGGKVDESSALIVWCAVHPKHVGDLRVAGDVGETIRTQQDDVPVQQAAAFDVDPRGRRASTAEGLCDEVTEIAGTRAELARLHEQ